MKKEIEQYEWIEDYLTGKLPAEDVKLLEQKIAKDHAFAKQVEAHRRLNSVIEESSYLEVRKNLQEIHRNALSTGNGFFSKPGSYFMLIGGFLGIIAFFIILNQRSRSGTDKKSYTIIQEDRAAEFNGWADDSLKLTVQENNSNSHDDDEPMPVNKEIKTSITQPAKSTKEIDESSFINREEQDPLTDTVLNPVRHKELIGTEVTKTTIKEEILSGEPAESSVSAVNCENTVHSAIIHLEESCLSEATGSIQIDKESIQGGLPPFLVSIDNSGNYHTQYTFRNLTPGNYIIWIKDKNNCMTRLGNYRIESIDCQYDFVFAPEKTERWKVPSNELKTLLRIFNKRGTEVFRRYIEPGEKFEWDGTSQNSIPLPMGIYSFILEFDERESLTGTVTIVR